MTITRRAVLTTGAAFASTGFTSNRAFSALDLTAPENKIEVYRRMRGGVDDGALVLYWWNGFVWAKPNDDVAVHILTVEGLTFQRLTTNPDGTLSEAQAGRGTFRDPDTNEPLKTWTNPINGVTAEPDHIRSLNRGSITAAGQVRNLNDRLVQFDSEITAPIITGKQIFMRENFVSKTTTATPGVFNTSSSLTTYTSNAVDIADDSAAFRPCNFNYQSLGGFRPWMGMDNNTGALSWQTVGQKLQRGADDAPEGIRTWVDANYPGFLVDPKI